MYRKKYIACALVHCFTLCRIPLSVFAYREIAKESIHVTAYLLLFLVIAVSDFLDGKLARVLHVQSTFGAVEDVVCDFFYIITAYYALWQVGLLPGWTLILITAKLGEFIVSSVLMRGSRSHIFMFDRIGRYTAIGFYLLPASIVLCSMLSFFLIIRDIFCVSLLVCALVSSYHRFAALSRGHLTSLFFHRRA